MGINLHSFRRMAFGLTLAILAACAPLPRTLAPALDAPHGGSKGATQAVARAVPDAVARTQVEIGATVERAPFATGHAEIHFSVKWPERPRGVAALPNSTEALTYEITAPDLGVVSGTLGRQSGVLVSSHSVVITPQDQVQVRIRAYGQNPPCPGGTCSAILAEGVATAAALVNTRVIVPITLVVAGNRTPSVTALSASSGGPGFSVNLTVANVIAGLPYTLHLGSATASPTLNGVTMNSTVPVGAITGTWALVVDGVSATSSTQFKVLSSIAFGAFFQGNFRAQGVDAFQYKAIGTTTEGATIDSPGVTWSISPAPAVLGAATASPPATAQMEAVGYLHDAPATGSFWVYVYSGSLSASKSLTVVASNSI